MTRGQGRIRPHDAARGALTHNPKVAGSPARRSGRATGTPPRRRWSIDRDTTLILGLNLAATFVFGLSGGLAAVRAQLDLFGVLVLAGVVGLAGGIIRDLLIGVPPETFRDGRYLVAAGAAGAACFFASRRIERAQRSVLFFDAVGLSLFAVTGASKAVASGMGPAQAALLGAITAIGGGMLRDVLLRDVPTVLRSDLYAIPALVGAAVVAIAHEAGSDAGLYAVAGAGVCLVLRLVGMRYGVTVPIARRGDGEDDDTEDAAT